MNLNGFTLFLFLVLTFYFFTSLLFFLLPKIHPENKNLIAKCHFFFSMRAFHLCYPLAPPNLLFKSLIPSRGGLAFSESSSVRQQRDCFSIYIILNEMPLTAIVARHSKPSLQDEGDGLFCHFQLPTAIRTCLPANQSHFVWLTATFSLFYILNWLQLHFKSLKLTWFLSYKL